LNVGQQETQLRESKEGNNGEEKPDSPELPTSETKNQSLAQIIYAENRVRRSPILKKKKKKKLEISVAPTQPYWAALGVFDDVFQPETTKMQCHLVKILL
jgi:hypothetical protein